MRSGGPYRLFYSGITPWLSPVSKAAVQAAHDTVKATEGLTARHPEIAEVAIWRRWQVSATVEKRGIGWRELPKPTALVVVVPVETEPAGMIFHVLPITDGVRVGHQGAATVYVDVKSALAGVMTAVQAYDAAHPPGPVSDAPAPVPAAVAVIPVKPQRPPVDYISRLDWNLKGAPAAATTPVAPRSPAPGDHSQGTPTARRRPAGARR